MEWRKGAEGGREETDQSLCHIVLCKQLRWSSKKLWVGTWDTQGLPQYLEGKADAPAGLLGSFSFTGGVCILPALLCTELPQCDPETPRRKHFTLKPEKRAFVLSVAYETQLAEKEIESLWLLYSEDQWSEKMVGLYPNRLSYISFQASLLYKGVKV